jgi:hypothetical protein
MTHEGLITGTEACWRPLPGNKLSLYGWTDRNLQVGDYLILSPRKGETTRYKLTHFRRPGDPRDMWFGTADFAPREAPL